MRKGDGYFAISQGRSPAGFTCFKQVVSEKAPEPKWQEATIRVRRLRRGHENEAHIEITSTHFAGKQGRTQSTLMRLNKLQIKELIDALSTDRRTKWDDDE